MSTADILTTLLNSSTEKFAVFYHTAKGVFGHVLSEGDEGGVFFSAKDVIEGAIEAGATMVSIAHNHPTGDVRPSTKDLEATFTLQDRLKANGLMLRDHVIVGPEGSPFSMLKEGVL